MYGKYRCFLHAFAKAYSTILICFIQNKSSVIYDFTAFFKRIIK
ncbi:hypothetical protein JCM19275_2117 [Nonlabens ulvanivorans]|uniref:Uncharacterized protein n=1 Tax=Nonlabens ulvanivorans TaxID=906888 RepID=A0A090WIG9_NONUL|nr:hypothetical protein JCM19275_2117 [Nonlabens ulvanivorans]